MHNRSIDAFLGIFLFSDDSCLSDPSGFRMAGQPMIPMLPVMIPGQPGLQSPGAADPGFPRMMGPGNVVYPKGPYPQLQQMPAQFMKMNQQVRLRFYFLPSCCSLNMITI